MRNESVILMKRTTLVSLVGAVLRTLSQNDQHEAPCLALYGH